ncbi:MAG: putative peptide maturation dehydrogenase [Pseudomonadota bacterium]|nr:putative peptide maturation dehydrogenase [Pseudomonadota bacterium]
MKIQRCSVLAILPEQDVTFSLESLLAGGDGLCSAFHWRVYAPHVGEVRQVNLDQLRLLGRLSPHWPSSIDALPADARAACDELLAAGLLLSDDPRHRHWRERDQTLRAMHWHPLAAIQQVFSRWQDVDSLADMRQHKLETAEQIMAAHGAPPPETMAAVTSAEVLALPPVDGNDFDALLARRSTCRNFDRARDLPMAEFARLLQRVFAVQATVEAVPGMRFVKKTSPSGGGLHPLEAYLLVQHVEGIAPGIYHYLAADHALQVAAPLPEPDALLRGLAGQDWFADAHVLVVMVARFERTFWKYRRHAKASRVLALECGHLSQTLYLAATEVGLGAFITAAINEADWEQWLDLDPLQHGVLAVCGFGWRADQMRHAEFDPLHKVWPAKR